MDFILFFPKWQHLDKLFNTLDAVEMSEVA